MSWLSNLFKSKKTSDTTTTQTTTPTIPTWVQGPITDVTTQIGALSQKDPYSFIAPASDLQKTAWSRAQNLGTGLDYSGTGADFMAAAGLANAPSYQAQSYSTKGYDPTGYGAATYGAKGYDSKGYTGTGYDSKGYGASGYDAKGYGATGYDAKGYAATGYNSQGYTGEGYDAATGKAQSLLSNLDSYMSPYRDQVVKSTLNDFDYNAGQQKAQDDLDLAASGAFGGSGAALTKSMTADNLARARATTESGLLDQMFQRGTALSGQDADRRQGMEYANMDATNKARSETAAAHNRANEFTASSANDAAKYLADASNTANRDTASWQNDAAKYLADNITAANRDNASWQNDAAKYFADASNTASRDTASWANDAAKYLADANNTANRDTASWANDAAKHFADATNTASRDNTTAINTANRDNAVWSNDAAKFASEAYNTAARDNAAAFNSAASDNATFQNQALDRLLSAGKGLVDTGTAVDANDRANLATIAGLGADQRGVNQAYLSAPLDLLAAQAGDFSHLPLSMFTGQNTTGTSNNVQTSSPSMAEQALKAAQIAAMFMGSDERLKKDIVRVGTLPNGIGVYEYEYIWGGGRRVGVMAQEVQQIKPEAVGEFAGEFLAVNYGAL